MKVILSASYTWNDFSATSPSREGALPVGVELPDGTVVDVTPKALDHACGRMYRARADGKSRATYVRPAPRVAVRTSSLGDTSPAATASPRGGCGTRMEMLIPKSSRLVFLLRCPECGEVSGQITVAASALPARKYQPPQRICQACADAAECE